VRHRIQRHALGIEKLETILQPLVTTRSDGIDRTAASTALPSTALPLVATQPAFAPVLPFRHLLADPADSGIVAAEMPVPRQRRESRLRRGRTHALALAAIVCGVAASPTVKERPVRADTAVPAAAPAAAPEVVSLSSDQYVVYPNRKLAEISVQRGEQTAGAASFVWWTEGAGAKPNEDFISAAPSMTQMANGVGSVKLLVPILANPSRRHIEMFYVMIGRLGGGARLGPVRRATVFIMPAD
jgi:hypothetical protein